MSEAFWREDITADEGNWWQDPQTGRDLFDIGSDAAAEYYRKNTPNTTNETSSVDLSSDSNKV